MRSWSRDSLAFSYIIYYIGVLNAGTFLFRQTVNIIFDAAQPVYAPADESTVFTESRGRVFEDDDNTRFASWRKHLATPYSFSTTVLLFLL